jgi:hypothetical protein
MSETNKELPPLRPDFARFGHTDITHKWKEAAVGTLITGKWAGAKPSQDPSWAPLGMVRAADGMKVFPMPAALLVLRRVPVGTEVVITYVGKTATKKGQDRHAFDIQAPVDLVLLPDPDAAAGEPTDDDVDF